MIRRLSLHARLLLVALATGIAALLFASVTIGGVLERFVVRGMDQTLDTQVAALARAVMPDGSLDRARVVELPGFDRPGSGWAWQIESPAGRWSGGSPLHAVHVRPRWRHGPDDEPVGGEGETADGRRVHLRRLDMPLARGAATIVAGGPRAIVDRPLAAARGTLLLSLGLLALGLAAATWIQLRFGLKPVRSLGADVARVRTGAAEHVPADQPGELRPLVAELNALIDQNRAGLEHARRHVANLAHGLKTPLATLALRLAREGAPDETRTLVDQLDQRIAHHLRRARSAAAATGARARAPVAEVADDLIAAMRSVHGDRGIAFTARIGDSVVAVERRDLEEMIGNLLDNAGRHAASRVELTTEPSGADIAIGIADDGPGMADADIARATRPGVRIDESGQGYGFGLTIAIELAELYGGRVEIGRSPGLGGLSARLVVPRPAGALPTD